MTRSFIKIASFNVRNLVNPGVTYYSTNRYSEGAYDRKLGWLAEQLLRMDADVVCLQEVFHPEPVEQLIERYHALLDERASAGAARQDRYVDSWHVANVDATEDNPLPGLAVLSRTPIADRLQLQDIAESPIEIAPSDGLSYRLEKLSRPLMGVRVDLGQGVLGWVFNAHLKSKRPLYPGSSVADEPENFLFLERAEAAFRSLALRSGEALALRRLVLDYLQGNDDPVIVTGDLNDAIAAVTTEMVAGEMPFRGWPIDVRRGFWDVELYSAARSHLRRSEQSSFYTHVFNGYYSVLDHILISQEFFYRNPDRIGDINFVQVFNDHLTDNSISGAPSLGDASDHGQIVVRLSIDSERIEQQRTGEFEVFRDSDGNYRFHLKATNGQVIAESQPYRSRSSALQGVESVRRNAFGARLDDQT